MSEEVTQGISGAVTLEERTAGAAPVVDEVPVGAPQVEAAPEPPAAVVEEPADIVPDPRTHIALDLGSFIHIQPLPADEAPRQMFLTIGGIRWMHVGEHRGVWLYRLDK